GSGAALTIMSPSSSMMRRMCPEPECWGPTLTVNVWGPESAVLLDSTAASGAGFSGTVMSGSVRGESYLFSERWRTIPVVGQEELLHSRMAVESYPEHLECLALKIVNARPDRDQRAGLGRVSGYRLLDGHDDVTCLLVL